MPASRILAILHQEHSTTGRVGALLQQGGFDVSTCCPCRGDTLPESMDDYRGAIVFGGPQSANDDHVSGIRAELRWLERTMLGSEKPLLGICLGAQQIARVLGAEVGPHRDARVEIGYFEVAPTEHAGDFLDAPSMFYQWHAETFEIPRDAVHLAHNDAFPAQAFSYRDRVYGIEFHPEMTLEMIDRWCTSESGSQKLSLSGAMPHHQQREDHARHHGRTERWLDDFLNGLFGRAGARR